MRIDLLKTIDGGIEDWDEKNSIFWQVSKQKVYGGWIIYRDQKVCSRETEVTMMTSTATFVSDKFHLWNGDYFIE